MRLKIIFNYDVNTETGEMTLLSKDEVTVDTLSEKKSTKKSTSKVDSNSDPIVTLESNKLVLTQGAVDLLKAEYGCRIDVKYDKSEPVIGVSTSFGEPECGNKLTKTNTVSYRGVANSKLSSFGTVFTLQSTNKEGIFKLIGDKQPSDIEIPDEIINIEDELDIESLDDIEEFDFSL